MKIHKYPKIVPLLLISYLTIYISCHFQNYALLYASLLGFSIALSLSLMKANATHDYALAILGLILALYLKIILSIIFVEPNPVLIWDDKARANVVELIIEKGHYPFDLVDPRNSMYRDEYIPYPVAFILAAVTSLITSLDITTVFTSPVVLSALIIIFVAIGILLMKRNKLFGWIATISLCLNFVTIGYMYPCMYSQVARAFIALLFYMLLVKSDEKDVSLPNLIVYTVFTALIPLTHSSESIAFLIAIIMLSLVLILKNFMFRERGARRYLNKTFAISSVVYLTVFFIWNIFQGSHILQIIINMAVYSLKYSLKTETATKTLVETETTAKTLVKTETAKFLGKFTPYDYTPLELHTILLGVFAYGTILLFLSFDTLVAILRRRDDAKSLESAIMIVLTIFAIINAYLYLGTPYKSDITWRFTFMFFASASIFFIYKKDVYAKYTKWILNKRAVLLAILLGLFISSMYIYLRFQNVASEYNKFSVNTRNILKNSKIITFLKDSVFNKYDIVFVDSPDMPYHILRDYIVVRVPVKQYAIAVYDPNIRFYKYRLLSGIYMYRFILLKNYIEASVIYNYASNATVFHGLDVHLPEVPNTIYNNGVFAISKT